MNDATGDALLKGILQVPEDDNARLIYADWLQDNGREDEADFIRMQCGIIPYDAERFPNLARALFRVQPKPIKGNGSVKVSEDSALEACKYTRVKPTSSWFTARRGFLDEIQLPAESFLKNATALFANHPIARVWFEGKEPGDSGGNGFWVSQDTGRNDHLPPVLWDDIWNHVDAIYQSDHGIQLVFFQSHNAAEDALSDVCLIHGWRAAGLIAPSAREEKKRLRREAEHRTKTERIEAAGQRLLAKIAAAK